MAYNKLQQEAIDCTDEKILVTACPGSGKTHTMVGAIAKYKQENPKDRVVAITFTRKAAAELNLKLYEYPDVESATIHSWSLKELKKLGGKYNFEVSLLQDEQVTEILKMICRRLGYWSMNYFMLFAYVMGNYNIDVSQGTKMKYEKILRNYIVYKRENQLYDFTDLPLYLYDMLNLYNERITNIDALYVDEFQDVDKTQAKIFEMVDTKRKFYVGDAWQSIYIFRGADESVLDDLEGFTHLTLNTNYRSYQSILDFATAAREHECVEAMMEIPEESWIKAARTQEKGQVYLIDSNEECWNFSGGVGEALCLDIILKLPVVTHRSVITGVCAPAHPHAPAPRSASSGLHSPPPSACSPPCAAPLSSYPIRASPQPPPLPYCGTPASHPPWLWQ